MTVVLINKTRNYKYVFLRRLQTKYSFQRLSYKTFVFNAGCNLFEAKLFDEGREQNQMFVVDLAKYWDVMMV